MGGDGRQRCSRQARLCVQTEHGAVARGGLWAPLHALEAARSHAGEKDRCIPHEARTTRTLGWVAMPSGCWSECGCGGGGPGSLVDLPPRRLPARRASLP